MSLEITSSYGEVIYKQAIYWLKAKRYNKALETQKEWHEEMIHLFNSKTVKKSNRLCQSIRLNLWQSLLQLTTWYFFSILSF